jgi:hypothetical protein
MSARRREGVPIDATRLDWWWERWTTELVDAYRRAPFPSWWMWTWKLAEAVRFAPAGAYRCAYCDDWHPKPTTPGLPGCESARFVLGVVARFPRLRSSPHLTPFSAEKFSRYWKRNAYSNSEHHMVAFVLNVWNRTWARKAGWRFDLVEAIACWDDTNRTAFLAWCQRPYFP